MDQWTKALVVDHLSPYDTGPKIYLIGQYLLLFYIRNNGAAFSLFANSIVLVGLIILAVGAISYMYARMINTGSLAIKLIFGMIVGGALGNIIDRVRHAGYVVDFIAFRRSASTSPFLISQMQPSPWAFFCSSSRYSLAASAAHAPLPIPLPALLPMLGRPLKTRMALWRTSRGALP